MLYVKLYLQVINKLLAIALWLGLGTALIYNKYHDKGKCTVSVRVCRFPILTAANSNINKISFSNKNILTDTLAGTVQCNDRNSST